jgi:hypothetical protein
MNVLDCLLLTTQRTFFCFIESGYNTGIAKHVSTLCWHHLLLRCWVMKFQPFKTHWTYKRLRKFLRAGFFIGGFLLSTVFRPGTQVQIQTVCCIMTPCGVAAVYQGYSEIYLLNYFNTSTVHLFLVVADFCLLGLYYLNLLAP